MLASVSDQYQVLFLLYLKGEKRREKDHYQRLYQYQFDPRVMGKDEENTTRPDTSNSNIPGLAWRTFSQRFISPSRLDLYLCYQPLMNLCALWLHPQDKHLKGLLPLLFAQSCSSEDSQAISLAVTSMPSWVADRRQSGYLAKCFFGYLLCSFCRYLLAASWPSADLTGKSFWLLPERRDWRPQDGGKKRQRGFLFLFFFFLSFFFLLSFSNMHRVLRWHRNAGPQDQLL